MAVEPLSSSFMVLSQNFDISRIMETNTALNGLAALAHETRLTVFKQLVRADEHGLSAGALAQITSTLPNTLSSHLGLLKRARLISAQRHGRSMQYFANVDAIRELLLFLLQDCCNGQPELCGMICNDLQPASQKTHTEKRP